MSHYITILMLLCPNICLTLTGLFKDILGGARFSEAILGPFSCDPLLWLVLKECALIRPWLKHQDPELSKKHCCLSTAGFAGYASLFTCSRCFDLLHRNLLSVMQHHSDVHLIFREIKKKNF